MSKPKHSIRGYRSPYAAKQTIVTKTYREYLQEAINGEERKYPYVKVSMKQIKISRLYFYLVRTQVNTNEQ